MRKALTIGACICCAIGAFFVVSVLGGIITFRAEIFRESRGLFALLTFTPSFILTRSKEAQMSRLKLLLTAFTEFIVIGFVLAMLFPKL